MEKILENLLETSYRAMEVVIHRGTTNDVLNIADTAWDFSIDIKEACQSNDLPAEFFEWVDNFESLSRKASDVVEEMQKEEVLNQAMVAELSSPKATGRI